MSSDLYYRVFSWRGGRRGFAKESGDDLKIELEITRLPPIFKDAFEVNYGEFCKGVKGYDPYVKDNIYDKQRDMTAPEIEAILGWLRGMYEGAMSRFDSVVPPLDRRTK